MLSRKAFTLAEFLIATTVLAILSAMTVFTVSKISDKAVAESVSSKTLSSVADLDRAVRDGTLGSYETTFASWALWTVTVTDFSGLSASGALTSFDWVGTSGVFKLSAPSPGQWALRLAQDSKIVETVSLFSASASVPFKFDTGRRDEYSASFFYGSEPANRVVMRYFDRDGPLVEDQARLKFLSVTAGTVEYPTFAIRNVLWKKEFLAGGLSVGQATLKLVRGGREYFIELRK